MKKSDKKIVDRVEEGRTLLMEHIRGEGLRWTKQRDDVLCAFLAADSHISAEELFELIKKQTPDLGFATVYRCMNLFVEAGIAKERRFNEERVRFESAVAVKHHDHLICVECGKIVEFEDDRIEMLQELIAEAHGFEVKHHRMELYGCCKKCR